MIGNRTGRNGRLSGWLTALGAAAIATGTGAIIAHRLGLDWRGTTAVVLGHFIVAAIILGGLAGYSHLKRAQLLRHLETLCQLDDTRLEGVIDQRIPVVGEDADWSDVLSHLRTFICDVGQRLQDAEQRRASAEVRARRNRVERDRLNVILSGLPEPVLVVNSYGEIVLINVAAERLFRPTWNENTDDMGTPIESAIECKPLVQLMKEVLRRKTPTQRTTELTWNDATGEDRCYQVVCRNLDMAADGGLNIRGALAILSDITAQRAIHRRNAEFVSSVSHEMKTPLSGIKAYVELLADGEAEDPATREEFLEVISGQADRLQRLIDNMLNLARIEAGVVEVHKERLSLNELLEEVHHITLPQADQKEIRFQTDLSPMYLGVMADRDLLMQTAINLVSNAIKYTPAGGEVTLSSRLVANEILFEVRDTGVGLSEEDCQRIFDKFYRVRKDRQMASGTGLGLPLARYIAEDVHGGRLEVQSELGQGSTFTVTLPNAGSLDE